MAFKDQFREGALPFSPEHFDKPPLVTYINLVFSTAPRVILVKMLELVSGAEYGDSLDFISVWLAKLLHALFACGAVWLLWRIVAQCSTSSVALVVALLLASSAGFIVQAHLITTDLPVVFFMLLAFWASQRIWTDPRSATYVLAGLSTGLTGAVKYNGVVIGFAMLAFHLLRPQAPKFISNLLDRRFFAGLVAIPVGFLLGNPFAAIEFRRFAGDLRYLFTTSPHYFGASGDTRYDPSIFSTLAADLIGWPLVVATATGIILAIPVLVRERRSRGTATFIAAFGTAAVYWIYFASRTNVQVRWLLILVPLILIAAAPGWQLIEQRRAGIARVVAAALIAYGIICSIDVDRRFASDPRHAAVSWVRAHVPAGARIESSPYTPKWEKHANVHAVSEQMPTVSGRKRVFQDVFSDKPAIVAETPGEDPEDVRWYSVAALRARAPDYIALSSLYFERFLEGKLVRYYPEMREYFLPLLAEEAGYEIVFDRSCCTAGPYLYPREILFLDNRTVILQRTFEGP